MDRRDALKLAGGALVLGSACGYAWRWLSAPGGTAQAAPSTQGRRWGMVIDLERCRRDCRACLDACRTENNVAFYGDERWDVHWIRKVELRPREHAAPEDEAQNKSVVLLCNHCDEPPCAQVCPVQATYKRDDGIVIVDHHRCIGCRYCVIACPYNARFFNFKEAHGDESWPNKDFPRRSHGVAEACTLCAHRLDRGQPPACVEACAATNARALTVGDLNDPESEAARLVASRAVKRIRPDLGTEPKVYYLGL